MRQTLFYIPENIFGYPMFGLGVLLAVWAVASIILLAWVVRRQGWNADTRGYVPLLLAIGAVIWFLLPRISEPGFGLPIRGYGTLLLSGFLGGSALVAWRGYRLGIDPELTISLVFWGFIPGIIGARVNYILRYPNEFHSFGEMLNITQGGLIVYGSLIGGLLGFGAYLFKHKLPLLPMLDLLTPGMLLGLAMGRLGCFLNGCCFGGACDLPWAVQFPVGSPPFVRQAEEGKIFLYGLKFHEPDAAPVIAEVEPGSAAAEHGVKPGETLKAINGTHVGTVSAAHWILLNAHRFGHELVITVAGRPAPVRLSIPHPLPRSHPIHPTQLYSAIDALVLCLFLLAYDPFKRRDGEVFALFLTIYPVNRFLMECIRVDEPGKWGTSLTAAQFVSLAILASVCGLWWYIVRQPPGKAFPAEAT
jgi:phosphatidylglycerol:prolipoprotein diacylglycerol transferase